MHPMPSSSQPTGQAWPRILPFVVFVGLLAAEPYLAGLLEPVADPRWLYGVRAGIAAVLLFALWGRYSELRSEPGTRTPASAWVIALVAGLGVFILWILLDFPPLVMGEPDSPFDPRVNGSVYWPFAATRLLGAVVVVPVMEELFWRSFLMRWLQEPRFLQVQPRALGWKALLTSSALFALEHRLWLAGLLAGLIYGELYRRTESLWAVVLAHAVTNGALGAYVLVTGSWGFW